MKKLILTETRKAEMRLTDFSAIHLPAVEKEILSFLDEHTTDRGL